MVHFRLSPVHLGHEFQGKRPGRVRQRGQGDFMVFDSLPRNDKGVPGGVSRETQKSQVTIPPARRNPSAPPIMAICASSPRSSSVWIKSRSTRRRSIITSSPRVFRLRKPSRSHRPGFPGTPRRFRPLRQGTTATSTPLRPLESLFGRKSLVARRRE